MATRRARAPEVRRASRNLSAPFAGWIAHAPCWQEADGATWRLRVAPEPHGSARVVLQRRNPGTGRWGIRSRGVLDPTGPTPADPPHAATAPTWDLRVRTGSPADMRRWLMASAWLAAHDPRTFAPRPETWLAVRDEAWADAVEREDVAGRDAGRARHAAWRAMGLLTGGLSPRLGKGALRTPDPTCPFEAGMTGRPWNTALPTRPTAGQIAKAVGPGRTAGPSYLMTLMHGVASGALTTQKLLGAARRGENRGNPIFRVALETARSRNLEDAEKMVALLKGLGASMPTIWEVMNQQSPAIAAAWWARRLEWASRADAAGAHILFAAKVQAAGVGPFEALAYVSRNSPVSPAMAAVIPDAVWQAMTEPDRVMCLTHADPQVRLRAMLVGTSEPVAVSTPRRTGPRPRR